MQPDHAALQSPAPGPPLPPAHPPPQGGRSFPAPGMEPRFCGLVKGGLECAVPPAPAQRGEGARGGVGGGCAETAPSSRDAQSQDLNYPLRTSVSSSVLKKKTTKQSNYVKIRLQCRCRIIPGSGDTLEEKTATHSSILAWRSP